MILINNDYQRNPSIPAPNQPDIISDAPRDILTFIASLLPMNSLGQFSLVSKKFYQITKNEALWKLFIDKLQIIWNEKVGARQELTIFLTLKKYTPGLHAHVAGLLGPTAFSKLPTLNLPGAASFTMNFFSAEQVTSPIMKGVDLNNRPLIAIRYTNRKAAQPTEKRVVLVFHKYASPYNKNDKWESGTTSFPHSCFVEGTLNSAAIDYMDRLITGKPCGESLLFEQRWGDPKTMPDGKSVVELA